MKKKNKLKITALTAFLGLAVSGTGALSPAMLVLADDGTQPAVEEATSESNPLFEISEITFSTNEASPGDQVSVRALTNGSRHHVFSLMLEIPVNDEKSEHVYLMHGENDVLEGHFTIGDNWANGSHSVNDIKVTALDQSVSDFDLSETKVGSFNVTGSNEIFDGPVVNSVTLDKSEVRLDEAVTISVDVTHASDIEELIVTFADEGNVTHSVSFEDGATVHTKDLSGWTEGIYRVTGIFIRDKAGNREYYEENDNLDEVELPTLSISNEYPDTQGPLVTSVTFDKTEYKPGDYIKVNVEAHDSTDISFITVEIADRSGETKTHYIFKNEDGELTTDFMVDETWLNGEYKIVRITGEDSLHNTSEFVPGEDTADLSVGTFEVRASSEDREAPQIEGIELSNIRLRPGDTGSVKFYLSDANDIIEASVGLYEEDTNIAIDIFDAELQDDGSYKCEYKVDNQWLNGNYDIRIITSDNLSNTANHDTGLRVTVYDSPEDFSPPVINDINIDKTEVKPGDVVTVTADITDDSNINHVYGLFFKSDLLDDMPEYYYIFSKNEDGTYTTFVDITDMWLNGNYHLVLDVEDEWSNYDAHIETDISLSVSGSAEDRKAPVVKSVLFDKTEVKPGDEFNISVEAEDDSGIGFIEVGIQQTDISSAYSTLKPNIFLKIYPDEEGRLVLNDIVDNAWSNDTYEVLYIYAEDTLGNGIQYDIDVDDIWYYNYDTEEYDYLGDLEAVNTITVSDASGVVSPLHVSEILFDKDEIKVGETLGINAKTTDPDKIKEISLELIDRHHNKSYPHKVILTPDKEGNICGELRIHPYDHYWKNNVTYKILSVYLIDKDNNSKRYIANGDTEVNEDLRNITMNTFTVDTYSEPVLNPADYSGVDAAIASIPENLENYLKEGVDSLNSAVAAVIRGKNEREQILVNGYANAIKAAVDALELKTADYTELDAFIENVPADLSIYTGESVKALENALNKVERDLPITEQEKVDTCAKDIKATLDALKLIPADYKKVDDSIASVPEDLSIYTAESVDALNEAIMTVVRDKPISEQAVVDAYAGAIIAAIEALEEKPSEPAKEPADYTEVDKAIASIPSDLSPYTDESVKALKESVEAVVRGLDDKEQERVDAFAKAINDAVAGLEKKPDKKPETDKKENTEKKSEKKSDSKPSAKKEATKAAPAYTASVAPAAAYRAPAPQTGDNDSRGFWFIAAGASLAGITGILLLLKRKRSE